ncbi:MAG: glycosyl transferase, partial [Clostridiales bacterium]
MNYIFVDDNADQKSSRQLDFFARENSSVIVLSGKNRSDYLCDEESHHWDGSLLLRFANYQNTILQYALDNGYDELF